MKRKIYLFKSKAVIILLIFCFFTTVFSQVSVWNGTIASQFGGGIGTQSNPYLIDDASQLAYLAFRVNNGFSAGQGNITDSNTYYKLMIDIDLDRILWTPIGNGDNGARYSFGGFFDGNNHYISNLNVNKVVVQNENRIGLGLFGYCNGATIANLKIIGNSSISTTNPWGIVPNRYYLGSIIGCGTNVTIHNCHSNAIVTLIDARDIGCCGGIIGYIIGKGANFNSNISHCSNSGNISVTAYPGFGWAYAGGILGYGDVTSEGISYTNITNCYNVAQISSTKEFYADVSCAAGIAYNFMIVTNCYNAGTIIASSLQNGYGICGGYGTYTNSYYLETCGAGWGGIPKTDVFMKSIEFVQLINDGSFTFCQDKPPLMNSGYPIFSNFEIATLKPTNISQSQATLNGFVDEGNMTIISKGFQIKKSTSNFFANIEVNNPNNFFAHTIDNLISNLQYQYRVFSVNSQTDTVFGHIETFITQGNTYYTITATVNNSNWGNISPKGVCVVEEGSSISFVITSKEIGKLEDVKVNDISKGAISTYTFENITADATIEAIFSEKVGINENKFENIIIYPNPTTRELRIESDEKRIENVEFFDVFGKKVLDQNFLNSLEALIDISHLPAGFYFLKINTEAGEVIKKVLKE